MYCFSLVSCTGFEDVIYQEKMCTSVSLSGVMAVRNYNRAWIVHSGMIERVNVLMSGGIKR